MNVNSTLIFSPEQYINVAKAYIEGTKRGGKAHSVASVFVSRVDGAVDKLLAEKNESSLQGRIAVDGIKLMYEEFKKLFAGEEQVQRPLWASTGTKNKAYSDVKYIEEIVAKDTVNTVPPATLEAFLNHGKAALTIENELEAARSDMKRIKELGIDINAVYSKLLADGLKAFNAAFESLMSSIETKAKGEAK